MDFFFSLIVFGFILFLCWSFGKALQLLTHPIWWIGEASRPTQRLHRFLDRRLGLLDTELAAQCDIHDAGRMRVGFVGDC